MKKSSRRKFVNLNILRFHDFFSYHKCLLGFCYWQWFRNTKKACRCSTFVRNSSQSWKTKKWRVLTCWAQAVANIVGFDSLRNEVIDVETAQVFAQLLPVSTVNKHENRSIFKKRMKIHPSDKRMYTRKWKNKFIFGIRINVNIVFNMYLLSFTVSQVRSVHVVLFPVTRPIGNVQLASQRRANRLRN